MPRRASFVEAVGLNNVCELQQQVRLTTLEVHLDRLIAEELLQIALGQDQIENVLAIGLLDGLEASVQVFHLLFHTRHLLGDSVSHQLREQKLSMAHKPARP